MTCGAGGYILGQMGTQLQLQDSHNLNTTAQTKDQADPNPNPKSVPYALTIESPVSQLYALEFIQQARVKVGGWAEIIKE